MFESLNKEHAVAFCRLSLGFERSLSMDTIAAIEAKQDAWLAAVPATARMGVLDFSDPLILAANINSNDEGLMYAALRPNGTPVVELRIFANQIDFATTRYSRWKPLLGSMLTHLGQILPIILKSEGDIQLFGLGLRVVDSFSAPRATPASDLLVRSGLLAESVFSSGSSWHCHTGRYQPADLGRVLERVEVDANEIESRKIPSEPIRAAIVIDHVQQYLLDSASKERPQLKLNPQSLGLIEDGLNNLHKRNKELLRLVLQQRVRDQIKLDAADE